MLSERVKILSLPRELDNKCRIYLTDFAEHNVVVPRKGEYRLIAFHNIEGQSCQWSEPPTG